MFHFVLVCGCGSLGVGKGADVGVGLAVTEHTAQYDTHLWTHHAPAAECFCYVFFRLFFPSDDFFDFFRSFSTQAPYVGEARSMRTLLIVLGRALKGCYCSQPGGGDLTFSRSSGVASTSATRRARTGRLCVSQRRRRKSGAETFTLAR